MELTLANPVKAIRQVSFDLDLVGTPRDGRRRTTTALALQWELFGLARKYAEDRGLELPRGRGRGPAGARAVGGRAARPRDRPANVVADQVDWVAKLQLLEAYRERHGLDWDDHRLAAVDLQYHDLRPERSLFARLDTEHLVSEQDVLTAVTEPPRRTRAYFRGQCLKRWASSVASANWDSIVFDLGTDPAPARPYDGSAAWYGRAHRGVLKASSSPAELLARLSA